MDKDYFIKLTINLYRLTLLFPKKEPLRYKARALADEILANFILIFQGKPSQLKGLILETEKKLEILDSYFELAKSQNWVSHFDILEIQKEYAKLKEELAGLVASEIEQKQITVYKKEEIPAKVNFPSVPKPLLDLEEKREKKESRQQKILDFLKERGKARVGELKQIFPKVSKRTLRRDFESLLKQGIVERIGEKSNTFYRLRNRT